MQGWRFLPCLVPEPVLIQAPCVDTKRRSPIVPSFLFSRSGGDDDDSSGFVERILIYIYMSELRTGIRPFLIETDLASFLRLLSVVVGC